MQLSAYGYILQILAMNMDLEQSKFFSHLTAERQQHRWLATVVGASQVFIGAFFWQGFALACNCDVHYVGYYFITGFGGGLGTVLSALVPYALKGFKNFDITIEGLRGFMLGMAIFLGPGTIWQRVVNDAADWGWSFTGGFFYMWLLSGLMFLASITVTRKITYFIQKRAFDHVIRAVDSVTRQFYHDATLAFTVGFSDAFFMGTCATQFSDNWLAGAFGIDNNTEDFEAMILAGLSTCVGFLIAQSFQNVAFFDSWADNPEDASVSKKPTDAESSNASFSGKDALEIKGYHHYSIDNPMIESKEGP